MKKQILVPVMILSCFLGAGMGSIIDASSLEISLIDFDKIYEKFIGQKKEKKKSLFDTTLEGFLLDIETRMAFRELHREWQNDFNVLVGGINPTDKKFYPGIILTADRDTYDQISELKRSLSMIKVGVDSMQDDDTAPFIRTKETDEQWDEVKSEEAGEEKTTDILREMDEILRMGLEICKKQRSDIKCE